MIGLISIVADCIIDVIMIFYNHRFDANSITGSVILYVSLISTFDKLESYILYR